MPACRLVDVAETAAEREVLVQRCLRFDPEFATGLPGVSLGFFSAASIIIALPSAVSV